MKATDLNTLMAEACATYSNRDWQVAKLKKALLSTLSAQGFAPLSNETVQQGLRYVLDDVVALHPQSVIPKEKSRAMIRYIVSKVYARLENTHVTA